MVTRFLVVSVFALVVSCAADSSESGGGGDASGVDGEDSGTHDDAGAGRSIPPADAPTTVPGIELESDSCFGEGEQYLRWKPIPGADVYSIDAGNGRQSNQVLTSFRAVGVESTITLTAFDAASQVVARSTYYKGTVPSGDVLELRALRGAAVVHEPIACLTHRITAGGDVTLPDNIWNLTVTGGHPVSLRGSATFGFAPGPEWQRPAVALVTGEGLSVYRDDRGLVAGAEPLQLTLSFAANAALAASETEFVGVQADNSIFAVAYPAADAGLGTALQSDALPGQRIVGLRPDGAGMWVAVEADHADAGGGGRLLHFASRGLAVDPDRIEPLPDDSSTPDYVFDPAGLYLLNRNGDGQVRVGEIGEAGITWSVLGPAPEGTESLRSSHGFWFSAGGHDIYVHAKGAAESSLHVALTGALSLECMGYVPAYYPANPP